MNKIIGIVCVFLISTIAFCEDVKVVEPEIKGILNLSLLEGKDLSKYLSEWDEKNVTILDPLVSKELDKLPGGYSCGCSWYCGGNDALSEITASSFRSEEAGIKYIPENIHDFDINTAWVVNKGNYGIGEYVEYYFKANAARVTTLYVLNGYMKSVKLWKENSRVKKLRLYLDDKVIAILNVKDNTGVQKFFIGTPFQSREHPAYKLKLEIMEVNKGEKYKDTAISEINLDGVDVHCVAKGSKVLLSNNTYQNIENLAKNDLIKIYDIQNKALKNTKVVDLLKIGHKRLTEIKTASSNILITNDHPILTDEKVMLCLNDNKNIKKIVVYKNSILTIEQIVGIKEVEGDFETYTIITEEKGLNCFIANGILVKSEK